MRSFMIILPLAALLFAVPLAAATVHVPGDQPTIQAGIEAAIPGDTVLVADGTYSGGGSRDIDGDGRCEIVVGAGPDRFDSMDRRSGRRHEAGR